MLSGTLAFAQGVTTSAINGQVTDENGEPLGGATVLATHVPTGTTYGAATDFDGFFRISGMRSGGPYKIVFSYLGFNEDVREGVYLTLGRSTQFPITLVESAKRHGLNPHTYLLELLNGLPTAKNDEISRFTPAAMAKAKQKAVA